MFFSSLRFKYKFVHVYIIDVDLCVAQFLTSESIADMQQKRTRATSSSVKTTRRQWPSVRNVPSTPYTMFAPGSRTAAKSQYVYIYIMTRNSFISFS